MSIDTTKIRESGVPRSDEQARLEEDDLMPRRRRRLNQSEKVAHWIKIGILILFTLLFVAAIVVRVLHLILPENRRWLTIEQVAYMDEFFVHGTIGAIVFEAIKRFSKTADTSEQHEY